MYAVNWTDLVGRLGDPFGAVWWQRLWGEKNYVVLGENTSNIAWPFLVTYAEAPLGLSKSLKSPSFLWPGCFSLVDIEYPFKLCFCSFAAFYFWFPFHKLVSTLALYTRVSNGSVMLALSTLASVLASHWHHFLHWDFFYSQRKRNSKITPNPKVVIMSLCHDS